MHTDLYYRGERVDLVSLEGPAYYADERRLRTAQVSGNAASGWTRIVDRSELRVMPVADGDVVAGRHHHYYRDDVSDWWCRECDTVTDYCTDDITDGE